MTAGWFIAGVIVGLLAMAGVQARDTNATDPNLVPCDAPSGYCPKAPEKDC